MSPEPQSHHESSETLPYAREAQRFFALLDRIYGKIFISKEGESNDDIRLKVFLLISEREQAFETDEQRAIFYDHAHDVFTAFFGIEYVPTDTLMPMIINLIHKTHSDVATTLNCEGVRSVHNLQDRVRGAQAHIETQARGRTFDVKSLLDDIFMREDSIPRDIFETRIRERQDLFPSSVQEALRLFFEKYKKPQIFRQMLKGMLNSVVAKQGISDDEKHTIDRLSTLNTFLESLKAPPDVADFFAHLYLREIVDFDQAQQLLHQGPSTLPNHILESAYNGRTLLDDPFVQLRGREAIAQTLISSMHAHDFLQITQLLIDVADGSVPIQDIHLRTGIGGAPDPMPLRLASYVLCSLQVARRFQETFGVAPKIDFFTGQEGAIACNDVDATTVRGYTKDGFAFIQRFTQIFYPDVADSFALVDDHEWSKNQRIGLVIDYFEKLLLAAMQKDQILVDMTKKLESRARNHDGLDGRSALRYAAFHVLCFKDIPVLTQYIDGDSADQQLPEHIISIGGAAEREFDYIRSVLVESFHVDDFNLFVSRKGSPHQVISGHHAPLRTRASLIAGTGIVPPYYLAREEGDVRIRHEIPPHQPVSEHIGHKLQHALTLIGQENHVDQVGRAQSVTRGMLLLAAVVPLDRLYELVADFVTLPPDETVTAQ